MKRYDKMSKAELIAALKSLRAEKETPKGPKERLGEGPDEGDEKWKRLAHELQVHQVELEMQNRELQDTRQALEVSRNRYVDLYDFAPFGYLTLDDKGRVLEINLSGAAMLGEERSRLIGNPFIAYVNKGDVHPFLDYLKKCREAGAKVSTDLALAPKGMEPLPAHLSSVPVWDDELQAFVHRMTITDITERKRAEFALQKMHDVLELRVKERTEALNQANEALSKEINVRRETEGRLRGVLEAAPDVILTSDQEGRILFINEQAERMFGYKRSALIGQPTEMLIPQRFRPAHGGHCAGYIDTPQTRPMGEGLVLFGLRKNGVEFPVEISLSPLKTEAGVLITSIVRDVTERKQAENMLRVQRLQLEEKVRELDDFVQVVSHDLKEPLRGISAFSSFLLEDYASRLDEEGVRHLQYLKESTCLMEDLIQDLLTLTAISKKPSNDEEVDLNIIMKEVQQALAFSIAEKRTVISLSFPFPRVRCDPVQIAEVFKNLLSNAIKFNTATPPRVKIAAKEEETFTLFSVKDNGIGIDPRYSEQIFGLFERLHPQEAFEGTGAGLAISKKVIDGYGGKIWVESQPGEGSTFFFTIPKKNSR